MTTIQKIENLIRDHLTGTDRIVTKANMCSLASHLVSFEIPKEDEFETAWEGLRKDGYLIELVKLDKDTGKPLYRWEI